MRRFEFSEGTSNKFWEVETRGKELRVRFGKIGANGQTTLKELASPAAAEAEMAKLIAEKTKKGYAEAGAKAKAKPVAASAARSPSGIKATELKVEEVRGGGGSVHRIVIEDHVAVATGQGCFASSDGKKFYRRSSPGTSYGLFSIDGILYSMGGPFAVSTDQGAKWREIKPPFKGYIFTILRDASGAWWLGCDQGVVLTSDRPDKNWKPAKLEMPGKVMDFAELDGKLWIVGAGCGTWDGKKLTALKGPKKSEVITRITEGPKGTIILLGDGGVAYRSTDRGKSFVKVKTPVDNDLEDCAWVAGSLFVVGGGWGGAVLLRSDDEGKTFKKLPSPSTRKLWSIASWGDGAVLGGDGGIYTLSSPKDTYWKGAKDRFAPPPAQVDGQFTPFAARSETERAAKFEKLFADAVAEHQRSSVPNRAARPKDANPELALAVDDGVDGAEAIYADWLSETGDPRGELAQLQLRLKKDPKNKELRKAEKALVKEHAATLLGPLATGLDDVMTLEWKAGFITKARVANTYERDDDYGEADAATKAKQKPATIEQVVEWLLDSPSGRFLRDLTVGIVTFADNDYGAIAKLIGKRYLPALRSLFLGDFHSEETELNWSSLGNLDPMFAALPNLETLRLRSGSMKLGTIVLPRLKHFEVITGGMDAKSAKAIASAQWPSLEKLSVQYGPEPSGAAPKPADVLPILDGDNLPHLNHLGLTNLNFTGQLVERIAASKVLPQLAELDLKMGTLGDDSITKLFALQKAFAHLSKLDVDDNFISNDGKALLEQAKLNFHFGEQREDEGDPSERYASAYE